MGIYFATIGLGNKLAGTIGVYSQQLGEKKVFLGINLICIIVGVTVIIFHNGLKKVSTRKIKLAPVAQLDRAFDFGSKG